MTRELLITAIYPLCTMLVIVTVALLCLAAWMLRPPRPR